MQSKFNSKTIQTKLWSTTKWIFKKLVKPRYFISISLFVLLGVNLGEICFALGLYFEAKGLQSHSWNRFFEFGKELGNADCTNAYAWSEVQRLSGETFILNLEYAANHGNLEAQEYLMQRYKLTHPELSIKYALMASDQESPKAAMELARISLDKLEYSNALHYLMLAKERRNYESYSYFGFLLEMGVFGIKDTDKAIEFYTEGREHRDWGSTYRLGLWNIEKSKVDLREYFDDGEDAKRAGVYYLLQAASEDHEGACYEMANMLSAEAERTQNKLLFLLSDFYSCKGSYADPLDKLSTLKKVDTENCGMYFNDL